MNVPDAKTVGQRLRWLRELKELTLREVAVRLDCDPGYLSKLESGKAKNPTERFLIGVEREFRINPHWLRQGKGDPFWPEEQDEATRKTLSRWSPERLHRVMAILDELPDALAVNAVLCQLLREQTLEQVQMIWKQIRELPGLPLPARLFWNDALMMFQTEKIGPGDSAKAGLTTSDFRSSVDAVKQKVTLKGLLDEVARLTKAAGMKAQLASALKVPQARVSDWLSARHKPSGEMALRILNWVNDPKRK